MAKQKIYIIGGSAFATTGDGNELARLQKMIETAEHNKNKLMVSGRRLGKQELSRRVIAASVVMFGDECSEFEVNYQTLGGDYDAIKTPSSKKEKPFYETLNEQKRRRSWRR